MGTDKTADQDYDAAEWAALIELLVALPVLSDSWTPHSVQPALRRALVAYEREKATMKSRRRLEDQHANDKTTHGPWVIFHTGTVNQIIPAMRPGMIADLIDNDANARLIVQAPNLLAACQLLVEMMEDEEPDQEWREQVIANAKWAIRMVEDHPDAE